MLSFYIISFVQVVLESLPVSSSGHIHLLEQLLGQKYSKELMYLLHIPTLFILGFFFAKPLILYIREYAQNKAAIVKLVFFTVLIDTITALFFIFFARYNPTSYYSLDRLLMIGFIVTALLLYSLRWCTKNNDTSLTIHKAIILGTAQGCALLPGISRFATVYATSCWLGLSPLYAFSITWFVQAPLIAAAVAKAICFSSLSAELSLLCTVPAGIMLCLATVVGYCALLASYVLVSRDRLWLFAYYMIIPILLAFFCINYYTQTLF